MNPLVLRSSAECCGVATLIWDKVKHLYICPCGRLCVNLDGRLYKKHFKGFKYGKGYENKN
jgi:hypothetical protein